VQTVNYKSDGQLIREYVESNSQSAFAQLAVRHASWVYSCALRRVRDPHVAEDVAQAVFIILAKKALKLTEDVTLNAWLFHVTRHAAAHALRSDARRRSHERKAASMVAETTAPESESMLQELHPRLDEMVGRLHQDDRQAVLLRFYQQKSMADVGTALHVSEDAAKKRVARAVEKLRQLLRGKGVTIPAAGLATALIAETTHSAPAAVIASCAAGSAPPASMGAADIARLTLSAMFRAKLKMAAAVILLATLIPAAGVGTFWLYDQASSPPIATAISPIGDVGASETQTTLAALQGSWDNVSMIMNGGKAEPKYQNGILVVAGNQAMLFTDLVSESVTLRIFPSTTPVRVDFVEADGKVSRGILQIDQDMLKMCWSMTGGGRPEDFVTHPGDNRRLAEFLRVDRATLDKKMMEKLQGTWTSISVLTKGKDAPTDQGHGTIVISGNKVKEQSHGPNGGRAITIDASRIPAWIDIASESGNPTHGIFRFEGEQFQMCWTNPGGGRPTDFTTSATDGRWLGTFQRLTGAGVAASRPAVESAPLGVP
jgi:RNA polymerase sigma factor (sigma-70 family)